MKWISKIVFIAAVACSVIFFGKYGSENSIFYGDGLGYYSYLPSYFCLNNIDAINKIPSDKKVPSGIVDYFKMYDDPATVSPKGHPVNQYTMGVALFELPFFLVAHAYAHITHQPTHGYSLPYHNAILVNNFFYILLGLLFTYLLLARFFSKPISLLTISTLLLASNLFWFTNFQFGMAHPIIFFLVALLINATIKLYENPRWVYFIVIALTLGSIAVIRPTDIVVIIIPLLYGITTRSDINNRLHFIKKHAGKIVASILIFFVPILPQLLFWKKYTGKFIYYSYANQGFNFKHPHIFEGLFGPDNGWLLYSPLFVLCLVGLFHKKIKSFKWVVLILTPIYVYIIYSWWCFAYINGFGSRPMIHLYALFALPLAACFQMASDQKVWRTILFVLVGFFIYLNLHFTYIQYRGKYWSESSNYKFYISSMFKNNLSYNDLVIFSCALSQPRAEDVVREEVLAYYNYKSDTTYDIIYEPFLGDSVIEVSNGEFPLTELWAKHDQAPPKNAYIKVSCAIKFKEYIPDPYSYIILLHNFERENQRLTWRGINVYSLLGLPNDRDLRKDSIYTFQGQVGVWDTIDFHVPFPKDMQGTTSKVSFWNVARTPFYLQFLKLETFKEK